VRGNSAFSTQNPLSRISPIESVAITPKALFAALPIGKASRGRRRARAVELLFERFDIGLEELAEFGNLKRQFLARDLTHPANPDVTLGTLSDLSVSDLAANGSKTFIGTISLPTGLHRFVKERRNNVLLLERLGTGLELPMPEYKLIDVSGPSTEFSVETFGKPKRLTLDPNGRLLTNSSKMSVDVAIRRGEQLAEIGEYTEALGEYQKALGVNRISSLAHYRVGEVFFLQNNYQSAANEFREALNGDGEPKWSEVWSHINLGKIFDMTQQRERARNEYQQAIRTKDNTQGAQEQAAKYLQTPYVRKETN